MSELRFEWKNMLAADLREESCVPDLLGERILQNSLKFYLDETDEIYEGYGKVADSYPYRQRNNYTRQLKEKQIRTAVLENDQLKAVFLPDYGGRLWELWDKNENRNLLYTNDVLQFSNLAVRNAWFSGGVEWNLGIIGHQPYTTEPLYVAETHTDEGEPVLRMYEYERIRGVTWQMDFWLDDDCSYLKCRMRIVNESTEVIPMYWWSNMAVPEYEQGHITVPASEAYAGTGVECRKVSLPEVDGVDVSDYQKIPRSIDYFFNIPENEPKYIVNVDKNGKGLLQFSTGRLKGRKLFSWGSNAASDHWQEFLTKDAGRYVEIQAGLGKTQYGCIPMAPHTAWEWMECYGPAYSEELTAEIYDKSFEERKRYITDYLQKTQLIGKLEEELKKTKKMALTEAELITPGSGYGAFRKEYARTGHLKFVKKTESMEKWEHFFETGELHCPDPETEPDAFWNGEEFLAYLKKTTLKPLAPNYENWYAYYQMGLKNIDTTVPAISRLYVVRDKKTGNVYIQNDSGDDIQKYMNKVTKDSDAQDLLKDVQEEFESVKASDPKVKAYYDAINAKANEKKNGTTTGTSNNKNETTASHTSNNATTKASVTTQAPTTKVNSTTKPQTTASKNNKNK